MNKTTLKTPFGATATIYHQGAHVTSWVPSTELGEQIFVAKRSDFAPGQAIRGGVPVCFPQFAAFGSGAKHGFARNIEWHLSRVNNDQTEAVFTLNDNEQTRAVWPHAFELTLSVHLTPTQLTMTLGVTNTDDQSFDFSGALHTYFSVSDYTAVNMRSFEGVTYWDNGTELSDRHVANSEALQLTGAFDRVYFDAPDSLELTDGQVVKRITKTGFTDVVVWNPGAQGAKSLSDMGDDEYLTMLCIEAAIVDKPKTLLAGESWHGVQAITLRNG